MLLICVLCNSFLTLLVPAAANVLVVLYILRFFTGLVSAANLPVVNVLVGKWVVYEEKSMWVAIIYAGTSLGTVVSILTSGMILNGIGWEAVFYIHGTLPLIWCVVFYFFFADHPETQKYITEKERDYIVSAYGHRPMESSSMEVPWKAIFTSVSFWALIYTNTFGNFCWYFLLTELPLYMNKILRFNIKSVSRFLLKYFRVTIESCSSIRTGFCLYLFAPIIDNNNQILAACCTLVCNAAMCTE